MNHIKKQIEAEYWGLTPDERCVIDEFRDNLSHANNHDLNDQQIYNLVKMFYRHVELTYFMIKKENDGNDGNN